MRSPCEGISTGLHSHHGGAGELTGTLSFGQLKWTNNNNIRNRLDKTEGLCECVKFLMCRLLINIYSYKYYYFIKFICYVVFFILLVVIVKSEVQSELFL